VNGKIGKMKLEDIVAAHNAVELFGEYRKEGGIQ